MTFKLKSGIKVLDNLIIDTQSNVNAFTLKATDIADSTSISTGPLVVAGGAGIGKSLWVGGITRLQDPTPATSATVGGVVITGGIGVGKDSVFGGDVKILGTTESSTVATGALHIAGGVGISKKLNVGGDAAVVGNLTVSGNIIVNGTTTTINSTTVTIDDPIFTLGGDTAPTVDDNKDRGIEFRWHTGTAARVGFFGHDDSANAFTYIPNATNTSEVFSGEPGNFMGNNFYAKGGFIQVTPSNVPITTSAVSTATVSTTTKTQIDTWDANLYRSAKYLIQITQGVSYQVSELLVIHNNIQAFSTEYAVLETGSPLATFLFEFVTNQINLSVTMASAPLATINIIKTQIAA